MVSVSGIQILALPSQVTTSSTSGVDTAIHVQSESTITPWTVLGGDDQRVRGRWAVRTSRSTSMATARFAGAGTPLTTVICPSSSRLVSVTCAYDRNADRWPAVMQIFRTT